MGFPPPAELTSHQPPALLVAELLDATADGSSGRARLMNSSGLDLLQVIEGCAQTVAVLMGACHRATGNSAGPAKGMLVGVKDAVLLADIPAGAPIEVLVTRAYELPPFSLYTALVSNAGTRIASLELKTMATMS